MLLSLSINPYSLRILVYLSMLFLMNVLAFSNELLDILISCSIFLRRLINEISFSVGLNEPYFLITSSFFF